MTEASITIEDAQSPVAGKTLKVVNITGQLDESNVDEKIKEIYQLTEAAPQNLYLIFNLENLEYMNSKSIGYLTDLYGKVSENGGKVAIAMAKPNILDILQVVGLTQLIKNYETVDLAKAGLAEEAPEQPQAPAQPETPAPAPEQPQAPAQPEAPAPAPEQPQAPAQPEAPAPAPEQPQTPAQPEAPAPAPEQPQAPAQPEAPAPQNPAPQDNSIPQPQQTQKPDQQPPQQA